MKKTIAFVLAFAMTFATAFSAIGAKTTASATGATAANFNVELHPDGNFRATGANYQVQVALATVKGDTAKAIANWDTYFVDQGKAEGKVAFNPKKDAYYAFRTVSGDGFADPIFFKVVKNANKYKATVTPSGDAYKVAFSGVTDGVKIVGDGEGSGAFVQAIKKDGKETGEYVVGGAITQVGGTLQFIPKGNEAAETVSGKIKYNGAECTVSGNAVKANAKAVNVKIKKQANGPKVAINYAKGIATIPANSLYRVISADAEWTTAEWKKVTTKTPIDLTAGSNVVVQVMKDATAKAIMSKIGTGTITRNVLDLASSDALEYDNEDLKKGLKITNKSSKTVLQYVVSTTAPTKDTKWSTLKTTKSVTIKKGLTGAKLYFRAAAVAKEMKGPGETYSITYEKKELTPTASKDASTVNVKFTEAITGKITVVSGEAAIGSAEITTTAAKEKTITLTTVPTATTKLVIKVELTGASTKLYTVKELEFNYTVE